MATHLKWQSMVLACITMAAAAVSAKSYSSGSSRDTCQSIECVALSAEIASRMNTSVDPCTDFYNYACGNFPHMVKYNPLKATSVPQITYDYLLEDTIGLMSEKVEKNVYEMLVLDRVVTSRDPDMLGLYNFTRLFYRSCRRWIPLHDGQRTDDNARFLSRNLVRAVYRHLKQSVDKTTSGFASLEATLAALVRAGGASLLNVLLPDSFAESVIARNDLNLTRTARAVLTVPKGHIYTKQPEFSKVFEFLDSALGDSDSLNLTDRYSTFRRIYMDLRSAVSVKWDLLNCTGNQTRIKFSVAQLDQLSACVRPEDPFSWTRFFEELLESSVDPEALIEVPSPREVVNIVNYFKSRSGFTPAATSRPHLSDDAAFLVFDWLLSFSAFFPRDTQEKFLRLKQQVITANQASGSSVSVCMMLTKMLLQPIVERMYQKAFHKEDFRDIKQLVQLIKNASISSVQSQSWITPSAKASIIRKIKSMQQSIGLDDLTGDQLKAFYNATLVEFRQLTLDEVYLEEYFGSLLALAVCAYARKNFDIISGGSPVSLFMEINPLVVNAFNWVEKNQILFPMAILAPPIYHPNYPDYINLGSLGYIIGHEIGHSFDDYGHSINQLGVSGHFWDNRTEERYLERMECVRSRFSNYRLFPNGPTLYSNTTVGNDIADIMGITAAVEALRMLQRAKRPMPRMPNLHKDFTPEQMLFIQTAQSWCIKSEPDVIEKVFGMWPSHSPHHLRIRGIAENSPAFANAFRCRAGQPMNPKKKCTFW